ncbi:MAG: hypothetical protein HYY18_10400 [Planctomycetes bacterium]|nr:hypothetical protein [Planctomycetota bacterium]
MNPFDSHPASWRFYMLVDGRTIRIESVNDLLAYAGGIQTEADALEFVRILTLVDNLGPLWIAGLPGRKLMSWEADRTHELCGVDACVIDAKSVNGQIVVERFVGSCGEPDQVIRVREFLSANKYRWELVNLLTEEVHLLRFR